MEGRPSIASLSFFTFSRPHLQKLLRVGVCVCCDSCSLSLYWLQNDTALLLHSHWLGGSEGGGHFATGPQFPLLFLLSHFHHKCGEHQGKAESSMRTSDSVPMITFLLKLERD